MIANNKLIHTLIEFMKHRRKYIFNELILLKWKSKKANQMNDLEELSFLNNEFANYSTELEMIENLLNYYDDQNEV